MGGQKTKKKSAKVAPYELPSELLEPGMEGQLLTAALKHVYGPKSYQAALKDFCDVRRQTVYVWLQNGLPQEREDDFRRFVEDPEVAFRLPKHMKVEQFIRTRAERVLNQQGRNEALLEFLVDVIRYDGEDKQFGVATLDSIALNMRNVGGAHLLWKWAYHDGGIPVTYIEDFVRYTLEQKANKIRPEPRYQDPQVFASYIRRKMCVDPNYFREFYDSANQPTSSAEPAKM